VRITRVSIRLLAVAAGLVVLVACTHGPGRPPRSTTTATTAVPRGIVLIEYTASGGLCPENQCGRKATIYRDGAYHLSAGGRESDGQLEAGAARELTQRVDREFSTLFRLPPGPELCPSAADGSDIRMRIHAEGEDNMWVVTNCDPVDPGRNVEIPGDNPLLRYTTALIDGLFRPSA
jgi:hypothetical protein